MIFSPAQRPRVLFVDDEPRVLTTMRMLFRNTYELFFAESGSKALEVLRLQAMDVIVSDQRMPGMTGIELLRESRELNPHAMRILLTGYSDLNAIIGSINEGEIFRFVNKPWANEELSQTVALAAASARAALQAANTSAPSSMAAALSLAQRPSILVMDDDPGTARQVQAILGQGCQVLAAGSLEHAVALLEREQISVVISETRVQNQPVVQLIGALKQHHPELVAVILTDRADAGAAIELINQGQIYRLMTKPIIDVACRITVSSAIKQHQRLVESPHLVQRYAVERQAEPAAAAMPVATILLDRIRSLRQWVRAHV